MPTYEYACTACGQHVEVFQRISEPPLETCGVCGGTLRKVFHPAGIVFKGSGFYATDSRSKPASSSGDGKDASSGTSGAKDAAGSGSTDSSSAGSSSEKPSSGTPAKSGEKAS